MRHQGSESNKPQRPRGVWFALAVMASVVATTGWVASGAQPAKSSKSTAKSTKSTAKKSSAKSTKKPAQSAALGECQVLPGHELVITDLSVVEDARATLTGPWTFGSLISNACPDNQSPSDFVEAFFQTWTDATSASTTDFLNIDGGKDPSGTAADARTDAINDLLESWPRLGNGDLNLIRAPFRLLAITNRMDIQGGDADEIQGRFIFCMIGPDGHPVRGTLIMEYSLPQIGPNSEPQPPEWWAAEWHKLSSMQLGSTEYLEQLEFITRHFADRNVMPGRPNGSALLQFRVGEQFAVTKQPQIGPVWEFRAFVLDEQSGQLTVGKLNRTPHFNYNLYHCDEAEDGRCIENLIAFLTENKAALLDASYNDWFVQDDIELATSGPASNTDQWLRDEPTPDGFTDDEWDKMRIEFFGGRTCNGCHLGVTLKVTPNGLYRENFAQISPREAGQESAISLFMIHVIRDVRIPNVLSFVCPENPQARRAPRNNGDH